MGNWSQEITRLMGRMQDVPAGHPHRAILASAVRDLTALNTIDALSPRDILTTGHVWDAFASSTPPADVISDPF